MCIDHKETLENDCVANNSFLSPLKCDFQFLPCFNWGYVLIETIKLSDLIHLDSMLYRISLKPIITGQYWITTLLITISINIKTLITLIALCHSGPCVPILGDPLYPKSLFCLIIIFLFHTFQNIDVSTN